MSYASLLINTVVVVNQPLDKWGEPAGPPSLTTERGRIEYVRRVLRIGKGEEVVASALVMLKRNTVAVAQSQLRFDGADHPILTLERAQDGTGVHHYEALVG